MTGELLAKCPICNRAAKPRRENAAFPFCSARCKQVDLGKWLNEEYRVPVTENDDENSELSADNNGQAHGPSNGGVEES